MNAHPQRARVVAGRLAGALLASAVTVMLAACAGSGQSSSSSKPSQGGGLRVAIDQDFGCLDPQQTTLLATNVITRQFVDSLVDQDPKTGKFTPWLASSYKANDNATAFTFVLKKGITFSDGEPLNAAAVKTFFDATNALGAKSPNGAAALVGYKDTKVVNDNKVTVKFSKPNAPFLTAVANTTFGIQSPKAMAASPAERCLGKAISGTGPFVISKVTPGQQVKLAVRKDYDWASPLAGHTGRAYLDSVTYTVATEASVRTGTLLSGQEDIATTIGPQDEPQITRNKKYRIMSRINPGTTVGMAPNMADSKILPDPKVRAAIQLGIDRQDIAKNVLTPSYGAASSIMDSTTPGYEDLSAQLKADKTKAQSLLDEAGWKMGPNGIREKDGQPLSVSIAYFYQPDVVEYVQQQLRQIGVNLALKQMTSSAYLASYRSGNTDFIATSLSNGDPDVLNVTFGITNVRNYAFLSSHDKDVPEMEKLFAEGKSTTDQATRIADAKKAQELLISNNYAFPFNQLTQVIGVSNKVTGVAFDANSRFVLYNAALAK